MPIGGRPPDDVYERTASSYDAAAPHLFAAAGRMLAEFVAPEPGDRGLDLGSGAGAVTLPLSRAVGPKGSVDAVDASDAMVRRLRSEVARAGLDNVTVRHGDAADPPVGGTYDVLTAGLVLFLLPRPEDAVRRHADLLRAGGRWAASVFGPADPRWSWMASLRLRALRRRMTAGGLPLPQRLDVSPGALRSLTAAAGLVVSDETERTIALTFSDPEHWWSWSWSHGERSTWEAFPPGELPAVRDFAVARLEDQRSGDGSIALDVRVRLLRARHV